MSPEAFGRATTYPYAIPDRSFIYRDERAHPLTDDDAIGDISERTPVLAVGSNQSPEQLARKFPGGGWGGIPVVRVELDGFDSVYSPHIASYGAIAATLQRAPGVRVTLFVTWLTQRQLARMHETEISAANYGFGRLVDIRMRCEVGPALDHVHIYNSRRGTLCHDDRPVPLAEIAASGRRWPAMTQMEVQHHVRQRLAPEHDLETFIRQSVADADLRRERSDTLKQGARPFSHAGFFEIPV